MKVEPKDLEISEDMNISIDPKEFHLLDPEMEKVKREIVVEEMREIRQWVTSQALEFDPDWAEEISERYERDENNEPDYWQVVNHYLSDTEVIEEYNKLSQNK